MMKPDPESMAKSLLHVTACGGRRLTCRVDVEGWHPEEIKTLLDNLISNAATNYARVRGIRVDPFTARALGIDGRGQLYGEKKIPMAVEVDTTLWVEVELVREK